MIVGWTVRNSRFVQVGYIILTLADTLLALQELSRYDACIFFQTAASVGCPILECGNPIRNESQEQAIILDEKLLQFWQQHPNFHYVASTKSFMKKVTEGVQIIQDVVKTLQNARAVREEEANE